MEINENLNIETEEFTDVYRLPHTVKPTRYQLTLDPDLVEATFKGDIIISVQVVESTNTIFLNSHELTITSVRVLTEDSSDSNVTSHSVETLFIQKTRQLIIICLESLLLPGHYNIILTFTGKLNTDTVGFYRTWAINNCHRRYCAATYFEPTYARYAYPCFDEPHFKAKYAVSLVRPLSDDYIALSNNSVRVEVIDYPREGVITVHFEETEPISSYLTCFIVGTFSRLEPAKALSGRLQVSVYSQPDLVSQTAFARDLAASVLDYFSKYFKIDYPFSKLDLIGIPDSKLGGMENWGLITFRETALLLNPGESSTDDFLTVVRVVIHELSHMWFGNLVTIAWWNDVWLKEGMADFMSYIGGHHEYPSWYNEWVFLSGQVFPALLKDSALSSHPVVLSVSHPDQIREMFDTISYLKGSCLIRMLHNLDPVKFQIGLNKYLWSMKWGNATTNDLWESLNKELGSFVSDIMGPWTKLTGYPVVTVTKEACDYILTQSRFLADSNASHKYSKSPDKYLWDIPIKYVTSNDTKKVECTWFYRNKELVVIRACSGIDWIKLNWHNVGFYRVNYPKEMWTQFSHLLMEDVKVFDAEDRCCLINDAFCLASAGHIEYDVPLSLIMYLKEGKENDFLVWSVVRSHLEKMQMLLTSPKSAQLFNRYVEILMKPIIAGLDWDTSSTVPFMERKLRVEQISIACLLGFESVLHKIRSIFSEWIGEKKSKTCPEIRAVVHTYALTGTQSEEPWEKTWQLYHEELNPREVLNLLKSLASTDNPNLVTKLLSEAKKPNLVRSQDFFPLLRFISKTPVGNKIVWAFIRNEWPYLVSRFTLNDLSLGRTVNYVISNFCSKELLDEVDTFFGEYPNAGAGASERNHGLESIKSNLSWKRKNNDFLDNWFSKL